MASIDWYDYGIYRISGYQLHLLPHHFSSIGANSRLPSAGANFFSKRVEMSSRRGRQMQFRQLSPVSNDSPSPPSIQPKQEDQEEFTAEGEPPLHHQQPHQQPQQEQIPTSSANNEPPQSYFHAAAAGRVHANGSDGEDSTTSSFPFGVPASRPTGEENQGQQQQQHHQQHPPQQYQPSQQHWPQVETSGYAASGFNIPNSYSTATTATLNAIRSPFEQEEEEYALSRRTKSTPPYISARGEGPPSFYDLEVRMRRQLWPKLPEHQHPMNPRSRLPYAFTNQFPLKVPYPVPGVGPGPMNPMVRMPPLNIYQQQQLMLQRGLHPAMFEHPGRFPPGHPAHMLGHPNAAKMIAGPMMGPPPEGIMQQQQQRCDSVPAAPPQSKPQKKRTGPKKQQPQASSVAKSVQSPHHQQPLQSPRFAPPPGCGGFPAHPPAGPMHLHPPLRPMTELRFQNLDACLCKRCYKPINNQPGIRCTALNQGCGGSYHIECAELTHDAYDEFRREPRLEWICHQCFCNKPVILSI